MYEFRISWVVPLKPIGGGCNREGTQAGKVTGGARDEEDKEGGEVEK